MNNVSILFTENDKFYTIHEISALTGLHIRQIQNVVKSGKIRDIAHRMRNDAREIIVPLKAMEELLASNQDINLL
jgi:hypothetical protein